MTPPVATGSLLWGRAAVLSVVALGAGAFAHVQADGLPNLVASAAFCVAMIALCVTGPLMWWRRRPTGSGMGAPRGRLPIAGTPALAVVLAGLGVFLPMFGISLLVVLLLDRFVLRRVPALTDFFAVS